MIGETNSQAGTSTAVDDALTEWVRQHPDPNSPTISMLGRTYSPRRLLDEVREETPLGQRFVRFLTRSAASRQVPPEQLIDEMIQTNHRFTLRSDRS